MRAGADFIAAWRKQGLFFFRGNPDRDEIHACEDLTDKERRALEVCRSFICDFPTLADLSRLTEEAADVSALRAARVRFQGTDGARGRVDFTLGAPLGRFLREGVLTPAFVYLSGLAFAQMAREAAGVPEGARVVCGEDGRDFYGARRLGRALFLGLLDGGLMPVDCGVAPTPKIPWLAAETGSRLGAVLTASHNPADQNGVKFFLDDRKLLPEGPLGDFALSARMFALVEKAVRADLNRIPQTESPSAEISVRFAERFINRLDAAARLRLAGQTFFLDAAHGAYSQSAGEIVARLGLQTELLNNQPDGTNINRGGGVAELEGRDVFQRRSQPTGLAPVDRLFAAGNPAGPPLFGAALDGDGDRGFLLIYDPAADAIRVLDGDHCAYLCLRRIAEREFLADRPKPWVLVGTVESDLALFGAVRRLGFEPRLSCVGDKWISTRFAASETPALGEEVSGHVAFPQTVAGRMIVTGDGLFTVLATYAAILDLGLSPAQAAAPYPPGCMLTRYVYNVEKMRFRRGAPAQQIVLTQMLTALRSLGEREFGTGAEIVPLAFPEDPEMVYAAVRRAGDVTAAVFARNSGTENKTSLYARGLARHEAALRAVVEQAAARVAALLKNPQRLEVRREQVVLDWTAAGNPLDENLRLEIEAKTGAITSAAFQSLLYGLRKEGRIGAE
jgi:phosphoglucosamine mutase